MASGEQFDMGRVFSGTFSGIFRNIAVLGGFALILHIVTASVNAISVRSMLQTVDLTNPANAIGLFASPAYWTLLLVGSLASAISLAGLLSGLLSEERSDSDDFQACLSGAIRFFLPVFCLNVLWTIAVGIGLMLLVVPGVMLITIWSVTLPSMIAEKIGVLGSFNRSRYLTRGSRWITFFSLLLFGILLALVSSAGQGFSSTRFLLMFGSNLPLAICISAISATISNLLLSGFLAALYRELRLVKDGGTMGGLQEVFS